MEYNDSQKKFTVKTVAMIAAVLLALGFLAFIFTQLRSQRIKLGELNQERARLEERIDELTREQERLQSDLEFAKSLEGLLQYARDNLGYIGPDDIRIEDGQ